MSLNPENNQGTREEELARLSAAADTRQCRCCAFYGITRAAVDGGLCLVCAVIPDSRSHGHRVVTSIPELPDAEAARDGSGG